MIQQHYIFRMAGILLACLILPIAAAAQINIDSVTQVIQHQDDLFWTSYNSADSSSQENLIADDIEFYHDKGGITLGKTAMLESLKSISTADFKLRRAGIDSTIKIHLMKAKDSVYGALITGTHQFYLSPAGKPERLDGQAVFANLWLLKNGKWKMARVFSYDHGPAKYINKRKQIHLSSAALQRYLGTYTGKQTGKLIVSLEADHLSLLVGGKPYQVYPENENLFFPKDRDLTFEFQQSDSQKRKLVIREFGEVVEEAEFSGK